MSRPEIKTAEQLKGGAVAISRFASASDFIVRYTLQRLGLIPIKDVAILQVGPLPDRLAAMEPSAFRPPCSRRRRCTWPRNAVTTSLPTSPHWASRLSGNGCRDDSKVHSRAPRHSPQIRQGPSRGCTSIQDRSREQHPSVVEILELERKGHTRQNVRRRYRREQTAGCPVSDP